MLPLFLGIDLGSRFTKIVLINESNIIVKHLLPSGEPDRVLKNFFSVYPEFVTEKQQQNIVAIYTTGYGRKTISSDKTVSEITCHAQGVKYYVPDVRTIIDIGGQDSKVIILDDYGKIKDFVMNDKCAAGTGRFLEMISDILNINFSQLGNLGIKAKKTIHLSNTCVVFAESEIVGLITQKIPNSEIVHAVHTSIATRIASQMSVLSWKTPVVLTGGLAENIDLKKELELVLECKISIPKLPQFTGALGAALIAAEQNRTLL